MLKDDKPTLWFSVYSMHLHYACQNTFINYKQNLPEGFYKKKEKGKFSKADFEKLGFYKLSSCNWCLGIQLNEYNYSTA